jgi:WD40 repeat protein
VLTGHADEISDLYFSHDGDILYSSSRNGELNFWNVVTGESIYYTDISGGIHDIALSPDGNLLAIATYTRNVLLLSARNGVVVRTIDTSYIATIGVSFHPNGRFLATNAPSRVDVFNLDDLDESLLTDGVITAIQFHPTQPILAIHPDGGGLEFWNTDSNSLIADIPGSLFAEAEENLTIGGRNQIHR